MGLQICKKHWQECIQTIKEAGLWHLVPETGKEGAEKLKARAEEGVSKTNYDPLMDMNIIFIERALVCGGNYLNTSLMFCPLCEANIHSGDIQLSFKWITVAIEAIKRYCIEHNLQG